jgi:hypothetical protein
MHTPACIPPHSPHQHLAAGIPMAHHQLLIPPINLPPVIPAPLVISQQYIIPALKQDGSNFSVWHFHMHIVLRCYRLLNILTDLQPHPALFPAEATAWDQQDLQAFSLITLSLTGEPAHLIFHMQTAKECLECLLAHFKG